MSFIEELKRRNVIRVAIAYVVTAWLVAQMLELLFDSFGTPDWVMKTILVLMAVGLVFTVIFAWAFELTPEGIKRDSEVNRSLPLRNDTGKKLDRTIIVVLVLAVAYFAWESRFRDRAPDMGPSAIAVQPEVQLAQSEAQGAQQSNPSVAIMPFVNMSTDPEQEYFSDGVTEEIINAVVKIPGIAVPARTSVFGYKGHQGDVRKIGQELGVSHILEGSVRSQGDQVRITAQLIKVEDGFHLWSETFDRSLQNIFAVQEEIASSIADVLVGELGIKLAPVPNRTADMQAYNVYLKGRSALRQRQGEAITLFEQVVEADPGFAPAWAALAIAYQSISEDNDMALDAAGKALAIDADNVDALNAMGGALRDKMQWTEAERYLDRALSIDPNSAELLEDYSEFLAFTGRTDEALLATTRGMEIDHQLRPLILHHVEMLLTNGAADEARALALKFMDENQEIGTYLWVVNLPVWLSPAQDGSIAPVPDIPPALQELPARLRALIELAQQSFRQPESAQIKEIYRQELGSGPQYSWVNRLSRYLGRSLLIYLGENEYVIEQDIAAITNHEGLPYYLWTPFLAPLRAEPRFKDYLEAINLIEYWDATQWPEWCKRDASGTVTCH